MKHSIYRRILSLLLALSMCLSVTATAFAAETVTGQVDVETTAGNYESIDVTITIQQEQNADGSTSVQTDSQAAGVTTDNNMVVDYSGSSNLLYDEDGRLFRAKRKAATPLTIPTALIMPRAARK